jgi:hypothetical protein
MEIHISTGCFFFGRERVGGSFPVKLLEIDGGYPKGGKLAAIV